MPVKIESIRYIGRFSEYTSKGDTAFKSLVTLFAPNGNGKSTLSDLFRSLKTGKPEILFGRHTLNSDGSSEASIRLQDGTQARFDGTTWNKSCRNIAIFDETFIEETIHSGHSIEARQRQRLHQVVIGRESVSIQGKMDSIDRVLNDLNTKAGAIKKTLEEAFSLQVKTVCEIPFIEDVDEEIANSKKEVDNLNDIDRIRQQNLPETIRTLSSPCSLANCLGIELSELVKKARERVQDHMSRKGMGAEDEKWIQAGMKWSEDGDCPFCGQSLTTSTLFELFESYFGEEYNTHSTELESLRVQTADLLGDRVLHDIQLGLARNETAMGFWGDKVQTSLPSLEISGDISGAVTTAATGLEALLHKKALRPTERIQIDPSTDWIIGLQVSCEKMQAYNDAVIRVRTEVEQLRESLEKGNLKQAQARLEAFSLSKRRYSDKFSDQCDRFARYERAKKKLTTAKSNLRSQLEKLSEEILKKHGATINEYLRQFGTNFRITKLGNNHAGGTARTNFEIEINECSVSTTGATPATPHFGNTLSTGDKRALAFAFFLSVVNQDPELDNLLIIFDDPFSSLDSFRRSRTKDRILELVGKARVVFVMSHDREFLWHVTERAGRQKTILKIENVKGSSVISEWDIEADIQDDYQRSISILRSYSCNESGQDRLGVARSLRPALEGMFRREYPERFGPQEWLKNMLGEVRGAGAGDRIARFKPVEKDLGDILNYSSPFHHSDEKKDKIPIDPEELRSYVESVLRIIDGRFEAGQAA